MVSQEFKMAVSEKNLLRTRIMIKDSFVIDPTLGQLEEMISYARIRLPNLFVLFDGEELENDPGKWNVNVMNAELAQLVTNFSEKRLNHLKKVVAKVLKVEAMKVCRKKINVSARPTSSSTKMDARRNAVRDFRKESTKIQNILERVDSQDKVWKPVDVNEMEEAASAILKAVKDYKNNR